jgi:DNA end-binding protein Ku
LPERRKTAKTRAKSSKARATKTRTGKARSRAKARTSKARTSKARSNGRARTRDDASDKDAERERRAGPRALWSGTITFGLVSIPVELYPAARSSAEGLRMVDAEGHPLRRRYFCPRHDDHPLEREDLVRGYALKDEGHVLVTEEELDKLEPDRSRRIDLVQFVGQDEIDPRLVKGSYVLTPSGDVTQPYHLLARTMEDTDRAGIATFVMRGHAYVVAIRAESGVLRAETLRYPEELRDPEAMGIEAPDETEADEDEVERMVAAIESLAADEIDPDELRDQESTRLRELVESKLDAGEGVVSAPEDAREETRASVVDLMAVLKERLAGESAGAAARH